MHRIRSKRCGLWPRAAAGLAVVLTLTAGSAPTASPEAATAEGAWEEFQQVVQQPRLEPGPGVTRRERFAANEARLQRIRELGRDFYREHSRDPRRWLAVATMIRERPHFITGYGPAIETRPDYLLDMEAQKAWGAELDQLRRELLAAADASPALRHRVELDWLAERIDDARYTEVPPVAGLRAEFEELARRLPEHPALRLSAEVLTMLVREKQPGSQAEFEQSLRASPSPVVRALAAGRANLDRLRHEPMELKFTAIDGREVDLAKLRGKVVLIDFWATWCVPCVAELPNVKRVYAAYHASGLEVVGISLDREEDRQKLLDFVGREALPWPQHFDGGFWKNEIATRYAISSIPAMFLLDQEGKVVSTNARGEKLEAEVKRLLGR